eukprot:TRINITY_DN90727_c0_g1_i1.p1 TRINITY_DN90727_c0_g1~~TRINITY_DN90727_c0_g1_i1.p1  ORF type:complete len:604 (-),score=77.43 TRINITY_DN90727_c0_g1_i1:226-2037(-)
MTVVAAEIGAEHDRSRTDLLQLLHEQQESSVLTREDICGYISEATGMTKEDAALLAGDIFSKIAGAVDREQLRMWLSSLRFGDELLQHVHCPDKHDFTRFTPDVEGWCCEGCGEDLAIGQDVFQCRACDCLSWCTRCALFIGGCKAFTVALCGEVLRLRTPAPRTLPEATLPMSSSGEDIVESEEDQTATSEQPATAQRDRSETVKLSVATVAGDGVELEIEGHRSTSYVKSVLEAEIGIPAVAQSLFCGCSALQDDDHVADYIETHITLLVRSEEHVSWLKKVSDDSAKTGGRSRSSSLLDRAPEDIRADRLIVLEAVSRFGMDLQYASEELRADREVALAAWRQDSRACAWIAGSLLADREFAMSAVSERGMRLMDMIAVTPSLARDRDLVVAAVTQNGNSLACLRPPAALLEDVELLELAIANGFHLSSLARVNGLSAVPSVVVACIRHDASQVRFMADELRSDVSFAQQLLAVDGQHLNNLSAKLCAHKFILSDATRNGLTLRRCTPELQGCRQLVRQVVSKNGLELEHASMELRADRNVVMAAVRESGMALRFAGVFMQNDRSIVSAAVMQNGDALRFAGAHLKQDAEIISLSLHTRS